MTARATLPLAHILLALAVVGIWGTNFVVIRVGLDHWPPFLFGALRFTLAALPLVFFVPRPRVPWRVLAAYGVLIGSGQFALLLFAMQGHISPGLASLVLQCQVFFTIGLALAISGERVRLYQIGALLLAASGIAVIARHTDGATTPLGLSLCVLGAFCWACGNIVAKQARIANLLHFVVWSSLFSAPPLLALALVFEGPRIVGSSLVTADLGDWGTLLWQTVGNTLFGYSAWGWLLSRHPAALVTPMALLVPVFGMGASTLLLGEPLQPWKLAAAGLVMSGLVIGLLLPRFVPARA
ncbi:EamA family transporter [Aureimonas jatrophae]|uniref:O-acetylserine/cysteine efflux transporter n=1 Tax=Aureimonas jatrophae TaxID=1166073 RepID=A0A1H0FNB7_9HYPH|nr:EamA family transporter [Aureimonas jatrophae]MBB3949941.1 O-acetylserine/cysteine efflux transporter [Aureimonas jatrophae]SDN95959.1 O-acetylserine/cysteine efflux transporter [Aureimonas jatrophae]